MRMIRVSGVRPDERVCALYTMVVHSRNCLSRQYLLMVGICVLLFVARNVKLIRAVEKDERKEPSDLADLHFSKYSIPSAARHEHSLEASHPKSEEYLALDNVCLHEESPLNWTLRVKNKPPDGAKVITDRVFVGSRKTTFASHDFHILWEKDLNLIAVDNQTKLGTHMLMSHHAAHNNFHLHNNFLVPLYRAFLSTPINGLVTVEGCVQCWRNRLPMMKQVMDMMNLTLVYQLEKAASRETPMCFHRLLVSRIKNDLPYYIHDGRFSKYWPRELFLGYRDSVHEYYRTLSLSPVTSESGAEKRTNDGSETFETPHDNTMPVLSWMSRSSESRCRRRCIKNEQDAVAELSKYFHVNLVDFGAGVTTEQAVAFIKDTDVLIGLHGAGLGYTALLPDRAMVIELKSKFGKDKTMFLNMAASLNLPYYAVALTCPRFGPGESNVYTLPSDAMRVLAKQIFDAYLHEKESFSRQRGGQISTGECHFPEAVKPCGHLSSTKYARCYLRQKNEGAPWRQCKGFRQC